MSIYEYNRELHMQVIAEEEREEGERKGKIESLLMIMRTKGEVSEALEAFIREEKDLQTLTGWIELALKAKSAGEFERRVGIS